jgi:hypothetical protein
MSVAVAKSRNARGTQVRGCPPEIGWAGYTAPDWWFDQLLYDGIVRGLGAAAYAKLTLWTGVALLLPFAAQKVLERRDVV